MLILFSEKKFKMLLEQTHILRGLITETLAGVKALNKCMKDMSSVQNVKSGFFVKYNSFFIDSDQDFETLESIIQNEEEFKNAVNFSYNILRE